MSDLTLEDVRAELLAIIDANPDAKGRIITRSAPKTGGCFYVDPKTDEASCIVGRWLFAHPDRIGPVADAITKNDGFDGFMSDVPGLTDDARKLLAHAQHLQDGGASIDEAPTFAGIRQRVADFRPEDYSDPDDRWLEALD